MSALVYVMVLLRTHKKPSPETMVTKFCEAPYQIILNNGPPCTINSNNKAVAK